MGYLQFSFTTVECNSLDSGKAKERLRAPLNLSRQDLQATMTLEEEETLQDAEIIEKLDSEEEVLTAPYFPTENFMLIRLHCFICRR